MTQMRLDKFLGEMGLGTRSQVKELVKKGRVAVNGQTEKKSNRKIYLSKDQVLADGQVIEYIPWEYYMLNKPQGTVSATEDSRYPAVIDLIKDKKRKDLFPAGRLDVDTEGLLLITNDGNLAHCLLSPKKHVDKEYFARITGTLPADAVQKFQEGLVLDDGVKTRPAQLTLLNEGSLTAEVVLTIHEGKFHQVKRMFQALDCQVVYLKRIAMGPLRLDESLKPGQYRSLTAEERTKLKALETGKDG